MGLKASNYLPTFLLLLTVMTSGGVALATQVDPELNEAIQKKDWPSVVLILQAQKGQNFEHDLILARALLSLERRQEALALLNSLQEQRSKDERVTKLYQTAGTIFFSQETSGFYYEALELIKAQKYSEAKERLEQALVREPGQVLLLTRLVQMELVLGQREKASAHLPVAFHSTPRSQTLRLFAAKIAAETPLTDEENETELYRTFNPYRADFLENEVTLTYFAEALRRAKRASDLEQLAQKTLKDHPEWSYALQWFRTNTTLPQPLQEKLRKQLEKNLKDKNGFNAALEAEMKKTEYYWAGYISYEALVALQSATPTPAPK